MKQLKLVFTSDLHIGLKTDDIDRTDEIIAVLSSVVKRCIKLKGDYRVVLVLGGDIFNTNHPSEELITKFISVLNLIRKADIDTYIMVGNHDSIPDPERLSCLSFVKKIKVGYPSIKLIEDIKLIEIDMGGGNPVYFTFLPHISRALVHKRIEDGKYKGDLNTQKYIDFKSNRIMKHIGTNEVNHYVFSHLNVIGAHPGSEENLLKKSEVYLPSCFTSPPPSFPLPKIIQAHIHTHSIRDNIYTVGSPIFCTFGEKGKTLYCEIDIKSNVGDKDTIKFRPTGARPFMQIELDMIGETKAFKDIEIVKTFLDEVSTRPHAVIKFDITIDPDHNTYDWNALRSEIAKEFKCNVKKIIPRVVLKRKVRAAEQKIELPIKDKIKVYLKRQVKDVKKMKRVYKLTQKYLEQ